MEDQTPRRSRLHRWFEHFKQGFLSGIGWSFGVTVGFFLVSALVAFAVKAAGGLPLIGNWVADIVSVTQESLNKRNPYFSR